jgi:phosphoribosylformylglycinamidine (FGAM) synthase-like enzyme
MISGIWSRLEIQMGVGNGLVENHHHMKIGKFMGELCLMGNYTMRIGLHGYSKMVQSQTN